MESKNTLVLINWDYENINKIKSGYNVKPKPAVYWSWNLKYSWNTFVSVKYIP